MSKDWAVCFSVAQQGGLDISKFPHVLPITLLRSSPFRAPLYLPSTGRGPHPTLWPVGWVGLGPGGWGREGFPLGVGAPARPCGWAHRPPPQQGGQRGP